MTKVSPVDPAPGINEKSEDAKTEHTTNVSDDSNSNEVRLAEGSNVLSWFKVWEILVATTSMLSAVLVTFGLAFRADIPAMTVLIYVFDIIYIVYIALRFHIPYMENGKYVHDRSLIKKKYLYSFFIVDLVSVIPIELISMLVQPDLKNLVYGTRYERINRVIRFYAVMAILQKYQTLNLGGYTKIIRAIRYAVVSSMLMHFMTCGWFMFGCPNEDAFGPNERYKCWSGHAWTHRFNQLIEYQRSTLDRYVRCLYYAAATATSTGYGDIAAHTSNEKWFAVVSMTAAIGFLFGPILGYMASAITNADAKRAKYLHRLEVIKDHLENKSISLSIRNQVTGFYEHLWRRHQGIVKDDIFSDLPVTFQSEISLAINKDVLEKAPLFKNISADFLKMFSLLIKPVTYLPKQVIVRKGEVRYPMFYIARGTVEVMSPHVSSKPLKVLQEGSFFGELSLILNIPCAATCRATAFCELLRLERSDLNKLMNHFPGIKQQLLNAVDERMKGAEQYLVKKNDANDLIDTANARFISETPALTYTDYVAASSAQRDRSLSVQTLDSSQSTNLRAKYIFEVTSKVLKAWKMSFALLVVAFAFVHSYVVAFNTSFGNQGYGSTWFGYLYIIDLFFYADIIIRLRTAFKDRTGEEIYDPKLIFMNYIRSLAFFLDVISILPLEIPFLSLVDPRERWVTVTLVRTNRLLKLHNVFDLLKNFELDIATNFVAVRVAKLALLISGITHFLACIWFFQACFGETCDPKSWFVNHEFNNTTPALEIYVTSLYWSAATMTSTGYGDIHAHTTREEFIASFCFFVGYLLFGYCLSTIAAMMTNKTFPKVKFRERINAVLAFIKQNHLTKKLASDAEEYFSILWRTHRGEAIPGCQALMPEIPNWLQLEISYEEMRKVVERVPIFQDMDEVVVKRLMDKLITYVMPPESMVVYRNDVGREMYIVRRGLVDVLSKDKSKVIATIGPGGSFGEIGLIFGENRTADIRTRTHCEILMLRKTDLDDFLEKYPRIQDQFARLGQNPEILALIKKATHSDTPLEDEVKERVKIKRESKRISVIEDLIKERKKSMYRRKGDDKERRRSIIEMDNRLEAERLQPYKDLNPVAWLLSNLLMKQTIDPEGNFHFCLNLFTTVFTGFTIFFSTWAWAFQNHVEAVTQVNCAFFGYYVIFMYIQMHVAFTNEDNVLITHPLGTVVNYLSTRFFWDLISSVPLEIIPYELVFKGKKLYWWLQCNRLLNLRRITEFMDYCEKPTQASFFLFVFRNTVLIAVLVHTYACFWFKMACDGVKSVVVNGTEEVITNCTIGSWAISERVDLRRESTASQYMTSVYWSIATTCSVGYGDIHAHLVSEKALATFCMISGIVFFGYIIATITASLSNADTARAMYKSKVDAIRRFMVTQKVNLDLSKRIRDYYQFLWNQNKGTNLETVFEGMPNSLQSDITNSLYKNIIESAPLFEGAEPSFIKMLSLCIRPILIPANEYIVRKGDIGIEMYFVHQGVVELVSEDQDNPLIYETLKPGGFFGEISAMFRIPRNASARTKTNVELLMFTKNDLENVLRQYPKIRHQIYRRVGTQKAIADKANVASRENAVRNSIEKLKENKSSLVLSKVEEGQSENVVEIKPQPAKRFQDHISTIYENFANFTVRLDSPLRYLPKFNVVLILLHFFASTYMAAYMQYVPQFFVLMLIVDLSCFIEMFLKFRMTYKDSMGNEILDKRSIHEHYLYGEFGFDMLYNAPAWLIAFPMNDWKTMYIKFSLVQVLRMKKVDEFFSQSLEQLNVNVLVLRMLKNGIRVAVFLHISACIWFLTSGCVMHDKAMECTPGTWMNKRLIEEKHGKEGTSVKVTNTSVKVGQSSHGHHDHLGHGKSGHSDHGPSEHLDHSGHGHSDYLDHGKEKHHDEGHLKGNWNATGIDQRLKAHHVISRRGADEHGHEGHDHSKDTNDCGYNALVQFNAYSDSLYWALSTMTSCGYGDFPVSTHKEKAVACFVMIIGKMVLGLVLGNIASTLANMRILRVLSEERFQGVISYMEDCDMPDYLKRRVVNIYQYLWQRNLGFSNKGIFDNLPSCLHGELSLDLCGESMRSVPMFNNCSISFIRVLCMKVQLQQHHAHEYIYKTGEIGHEMYFIKEGEVKVFGEQDEEATLLEEGSYFGEESLVKNAPRQRNALALTHVDFFSLRKSDLEDAFRDYPDDAIIVRQNVANLG